MSCASECISKFSPWCCTCGNYVFVFLAFLRAVLTTFLLPVPYTVPLMPAWPWIIQMLGSGAATTQPWKRRQLQWLFIVINIINCWTAVASLFFFPLCISASYRRGDILCGRAHGGVALQRVEATQPWRCHDALSVPQTGRNRSIKTMQQGVCCV